MPKLLSSAAALAACLALASPACAMPVSGTFAGHVDAPAARPAGGPAPLALEQTGASTGPRTPFDGAKIEIAGTIALGRGSGPASGTITFTTPAGTMRSLYLGKIETDAQGRVTARARFRAKDATGTFADLKGSGTFSLVFTSKSDVTGRWIGNFKTAATRTAGR